MHPFSREDEKNVAYDAIHRCEDILSEKSSFRIDCRFKNGPGKPQTCVPSQRAIAARNREAWFKKATEG